jgi:hypothetical protein
MLCDKFADEPLHRIYLGEFGVERVKLLVILFLDLGAASARVFARQTKIL